MSAPRAATTRAHALLAASAVLLATGCTADEEPPPPTPPPTTPEPAEPTTTEPAEPSETDGTGGLPEFGVSAGDPAAVEAGMSVLRAGGNAVDAAIASAFAVAVVEPYASGIGGGGAAVVVPPEGEPESYDYREVVADDGVVPASGIGVPGFVAGMAELHTAHGDVPWPEILAPAIDLAREGHPASEMLAVRLREDRGPSIAADHRQFASGGQPVGPGDRVVQEDLAATMELLAQEGAESFYQGRIADALMAVPGIDGGSLAGYEVQRSAPARGPVAGYEVLSAAPALPGAALVQMLQVAEALGVAEVEPGSAEYIHRMSSAWQVADETVSTQLGDPRFVDVPLEEITDPASNAALAGEVLPTATQALGPPEPGNTTHVTVVDDDGLVVSMTNTIMHWWGSGTYVGGFFLNDQLTRFDAIGTTGANEPAPGRRSVSWSLPTVVLDGEGRPVLALGSPGGRLIPNILSDVIVRWAVHDQPLADILTARRFHLEEGTLQVESMPPGDVTRELRALGYDLEVVPPEVYFFGSVQALAIDHDSGELTGAADTRREADFAVGAP